MAADHHCNKALRDITRLIGEANRIATATKVTNSVVAINKMEEVVRTLMTALRTKPLLWATYNQGWMNRKLTLDRALLQTTSPIRSTREQDSNSKSVKPSERILRSQELSKANHPRPSQAQQHVLHWQQQEGDCRLQCAFKLATQQSRGNR